VLDGKEFMPDSRTTLTESDGHGGVNSIMVIE